MSSEVGFLDDDVSVELTAVTPPLEEGPVAWVVSMESKAIALEDVGPPCGVVVVFETLDVVVGGRDRRNT